VTGPKRKRSVEETTPKKKRPKAPAKTQDANEKQLVHLATKLAEKKMRDGTATSQMIIHYLKMGSVSEELAREKVRNENKLLKAKADALASQKRIEELYSEALSAMREYSGKESNGLEDEDYDD